MQRSFLYAFFLPLCERVSKDIRCYIGFTHTFIYPMNERMWCVPTSLNLRTMAEQTAIVQLSAQIEMLTAYIRKSDDEIIYDLTDLEQVLKVSRRTLFKWRADGVLPLTELGGKLYISKRRLFELIESNPALQKGGRHE